ncbi:MAG TPA: enoyl-CoA hydratase-related protein [Acidimicrobiales bacterium]|nr:enoyl-CoA hydratase-related protein [Acidimicrobiales bacterium]
MEFAPPPSLLYEPAGRKVRITLNRPEVLNAINAELSDAISDAIRAFDHDDELLVAIITGAGGRAFSTGADLKEMSAAAAAQPEATRKTFPVPRLGQRGADDVRTCRKPIIAAIDGYCVAAGLELSLYCDIRVATRESSFGLPEPRRSLLAGPGLHTLSRVIPLGEALRMQLTGRPMAATRAYQIGLVQELAEDREELFRVADAIADEILECAPLAVQTIKHLVMTGRNLPIEYAWLLAEPYQEKVARSEDALEGPRAFAEKRPPVWRMR